MPTQPPHTTGVDTYFRRKGFRARLHACLLAPYWDALIAALRDRQYTRHVIYATIHHALWFAEFAVTQGVSDTRDLTDELVSRYHEICPQHRRMAIESRRALRKVLDVLRGCGILPTDSPPVKATVPVISDYLRFLAEHRGIGERRIAGYQPHVEAFLEAWGSSGAVTLARLDARMVSSFVTTHATTLSRSARKMMCAALRTFLRFLQLRGLVTQDLAALVPVIPSYKLDRVPRGIAWEHIASILAVIDRSAPIGRRDYALLLVLATFGMRSGQVCGLRLDDLDWRHETLRVRAAKDGRDTLLPLPPAVGEALIDYLRHGRPTWPAREIFLRARAPMGPLRGNLTDIIKPYAQKAGLALPSFGPHAWRHACATRMLVQGHALKTIRDVLGHRTIETTVIYTKVDIEQLRHAALDWPEVRS